MNKVINLLLALTFSAIFFSCGADKLQSKITKDQSGLTAPKTCDCIATHSPVCGIDGQNYDNTCTAQCLGTTVKNSGHCDCSTNQVPVCGIDGIDHTECEAKNSNIQIVKFIPCASSEI